MNTPTKITLARIALIPVFIVCFYLEWEYAWLVAAIVFVIAGLTDMLDGHLARKNNQVTNLGKFLDPIADKLLVTAAMVLLVEYGSLSGIACLLFIARDLIMDGFRMVAADAGVVIAAGWMGKVKTTLQMIFIPMLLCEQYIAPIIDIHIVTVAVIAVALVLALWSMLDYMRKNWGVMRSKGGKDA